MALHGGFDGEPTPLAHDNVVSTFASVLQLEIFPRHWTKAEILNTKHVPLSIILKVTKNKKIKGVFLVSM